MRGITRTALALAFGVGALTACSAQPAEPDARGPTPDPVPATLADGRPVRELDPVDGRRVLIAETLDDAQPFVAACRQRLAGQGPDPDFVGAHVSPWAATATFAVREADGRYAVSCETTPDEPLVPSSESRTPWNDDEALDAAGGGLAWAGDADVAFVWVVPASGTTRVLVDQRTYYLAYEAHRRGPIRVAVYGREQRSDDLVVRVVFVDARGVEIGEREVRAAVAG